MLIPVDFTETSDNAVRYAIEWCKDYDYERIILLKTLYDSVFYNVIPSADYMHVNNEYMAREREEARERINLISRNMISVAAPNLKVSIALPGKYSFLYSLTHGSISEAIYRNAQKPVLILK